MRMDGLVPPCSAFLEAKLFFLTSTKPGHVFFFLIRLGENRRAEGRPSLPFGLPFLRILCFSGLEKQLDSPIFFCFSLEEGLSVRSYEIPFPFNAGDLSF